MSLHRPDKGWYTLNDVPQLNGTKAVYSSKVGPAKEVSVTPADHEEDTNKESPNDVAEPSSAAVSVGKAQLKNNDKRLPLDEAPPQEPAKKKAGTSLAISSSQVTDLSTDVEVQPPLLHTQPDFSQPVKHPTTPNPHQGLTHDDEWRI